MRLNTTIRVSNSTAHTTIPVTLNIAPSGEWTYSITGMEAKSIDALRDAVESESSDSNVWIDWSASGVYVSCKDSDFVDYMRRFRARVSASQRWRDVDGAGEIYVGILSVDESRLQEMCEAMTREDTWWQIVQIKR